MKLKQFTKNLKKFMKEHPEAAEFEVVTSRDDEGNGFNRVYYEPSVGHYDSDEGDFSYEGESNAVCLN